MYFKEYKYIAYNENFGKTPSIGFSNGKTPFVHKDWIIRENNMKQYLNFKIRKTYKTIIFKADNFRKRYMK